MVGVCPHAPTRMWKAGGWFIRPQSVGGQAPNLQLTKMLIIFLPEKKEFRSYETKCKEMPNRILKHKY